MRNIFTVNATQVVVSEAHPEGVYSVYPDYPKNFDSMNYNDNSLSANAIAGTLEITNNGDDTVDLSDLKINYYFTDDGASMVFDCYHAAVNSASGQYTALTDKVKGEFSSSPGEDRDTCLTISVGSGSLSEGDTLTISFSCHRSDWQNMDLSNDWSRKSVDNIEIIT